MVHKIWDHPETFCIQVVLPDNPLRALNSYVIKTPGRTLVIDTGFNRQECRSDLFNGLRALSVDFSQTALFLTHTHSDHIGLVEDFVNRGVPIYMSRIDHKNFARGLDHEVRQNLDDLFIQEGFPSQFILEQMDENQGHMYAPQNVFPAIELENGDELPLTGVKAVVLHTPGHTSGHMVLYLPEQQILFSGDHVLFDITPNIGVWNQPPSALADYIHSLNQIRSLPVRAVFPAHRGTSHTMAARVDSIIRHHRQRLEEICSVISQDQDLTAYEIAGRLHWSARSLEWKDFPLQQRWFATSETLAHLYYLADRDRIRRVLQDSLYRYRT